MGYVGNKADSNYSSIDKQMDKQHWRIYSGINSFK